MEDKEKLYQAKLKAEAAIVKLRDSLDALAAAMKSIKLKVDKDKKE
jgi:hypothetical protein